MKRILPLIGILLFVWSSLVLGAFIVLKLIVPFSIPTLGYTGDVIAGIVKVAVSAAMATVWLYLWMKLASTYFYRTIKKRKIEN